MCIPVYLHLLFIFKEKLISVSSFIYQHHAVVRTQPTNPQRRERRPPDSTTPFATWYLL